jgi:hypothetical protein
MGDKCMTPFLPPDVLGEPMDQEEQPEPTPLESPREVAEEDTKSQEGSGNDDY